jgi:hypothetical protein
MISIIHKDKLKDIYQQLPIKYDEYLFWLNEEDANIDFYHISTSNIETREMSEWNSKGREIYNENLVGQHAHIINDIIRAKGFENFLAQHEFITSIWFPPDIIKGNLVEGKIAYIQTNAVEIRINEFDGAFKIEGGADDFLAAFIDYPFLLNYKNVDMLSLDQDLVIKIGHHLTIDFVSKNKDLIDDIKNECVEKGLRVTP